MKAVNARIPRSDPRRKDARGECRLCEQEGPLRHSHIISRWTQRWLKKEGDGLLYAHLPSLGVDLAMTQDGTKHYLLCAQCEGRIGISEDFVRTMTVGTEDERAARGIAIEAHWVVGADPVLVQRFVLGTALRAHFATGAPFHNFRLSDDCVAKIRAIVLGDTLDERMPIAAQRLVSRTEGADPKAISHCYARGSDPDRASLFVLVTGGWEFFAVIHPDDPAMPWPQPPDRLLAGKPFHVPVCDLLDHPEISKIATSVGPAWPS